MIPNSCALVLLSICLAAGTDSKCPTWSYYRNSSEVCKCGSHLHCVSDNITEILQGTCATSAESDGEYYIGKCAFLHKVNDTNRLFSEMPADPEILDDVMCGPYNRKGLLCGECFDGFGPAILSLDLRCANCSDIGTVSAVSLYLFLELFPVTIIFIFLVVFDFNITSGPLLGYFLFCQIFVISTEGDVMVLSTAYHYQKTFKSLLSLSQIWNIHWFFKYIAPPFCLGHRLSGIHVQFLRFVPLCFALSLLFITLSCLVVYSKRNGPFTKTRGVCFRNKSITSNGVFRAFASFVFLSYTTVFYVTVYVTSYIEIFRSDGSMYWKSATIDPTIKWLSGEHIGCVLLICIPLIFLTLIPSILLIVYPTRIYRHLAKYIGPRKRLAITAFVETLHSCFKDGLDGTPDYRAFAGLIPFLLIPYGIVIGLLYLLGYGIHIGTAMYCFLVSLTVSYIRPCKETISNISISYHYFLLGILSVAGHLWKHELHSISTDTLELTVIIVLLFSHAMAITWAVYKTIMYLKNTCQKQRCNARQFLLRRKKNHYLELS